MKFGANTLTRCKYGWMLHNGPFIGKCLELYGQYSESEVSVFRNFLHEGSVAIDVGANIGDLTLPMSRLVGNTGRIFAFESHINVFQNLCANLALNEIGNVRAIHAFVADDPQVDMAGPWGKFGFVSENWGAPVVALDQLQLPRCDFLKIDVDGKELDVLRSGAKLIDATRPVIYFENDYQQSSPPLLQWLMDRNYALYWHKAPIFDEQNFFNNPVNHWEKIVLSLMVLALPIERYAVVQIELPKIQHNEEWWP